MSSYYEITGVASWLQLKEPDKWERYSVSLIPEIDSNYERLAAAVPDVAEEEGIYRTMDDCLKQLGERAAEYLNEQLHTDSFNECDPVLQATTKLAPTTTGMDNVFSGQRVTMTVELYPYSFTVIDQGEKKELDGVKLVLIAARPAA